MVSIVQRRLQHHERYLITAAVVVGLLLVEAVMGQFVVPALKPDFAAAAVLSLVGTIAILWKLELGIVLLGGLSMYPNPTIFDVQGRKIDVIHLVGGLIVVVWLLRRLVVQRDLRLPRSRLNAPLLALVLIWPVTWIAGYSSWAVHVPIAHRQPLFFVAEFGQLLMFIGVFWAVADTVKSERWAKIISTTIIVVNVLTVFRGGLGWNQTPVALALALALALYPGAPEARVIRFLTLPLFAWGLFRVSRIPAYAGATAVILVVTFFRSRRLFLLACALAIVFALFYIIPLWNVEGSITTRLQLAGYTWQMLRDQPLLGIGPTHYRSYAPLYYDIPWWRTVQTGYLLPHNVWLYHLVDTGLVGASGILWLIAGIAYTCLALYRRTTDDLSRGLAVAGLAALAGVLVQSVGGHMGFIPDYNLSSFYMAPFWILVGLVTAMDGVRARND